MEALGNKGYSLLYAEAPYNWAMVNPQTMRIYTYCEGDVQLIYCKNRELFIAELKDIIHFLKGYSEGLDREAESNLADMGVTTWTRS